MRVFKLFSFEKEELLVLKRCLALLRAYKKDIIIVFFLIISIMIINLVIPLVSKHLMDNGLIKKDFLVVLKMALLGFGLYLIQQGVGFLETRYIVYINTMLKYSLNRIAFKKTFSVKMDFFVKTNIVELLQNINMDVNSIASIADRSSFFILSQIFKMIGGLIGLVLIDWRLTLVVLLIIPLRYKLIKYLTIKNKQYFEKMIKDYGNYGGWFSDTLLGIKEIRILGTQRIKMREFNHKQRKLIKANIMLRLLDRLNQTSEFIGDNFLRNLIYVLGAYLIIDTQLSVGGLFAFVTYSSYVTAPIGAIMNLGYSFSSIIPSAKRFFAFLDTADEGAGIVKPIRLDPKQVQGKLELQSVCFSYNGKDTALENINLVIEPGEKVAFIGLNGSGKTTLIKLLLGFYQPTEGKILLDGRDIQKLSISDYRKNVAIVYQDFYLFDTSVRKNIDPFSRLTADEITKVAEDSLALEFIEGLPDGFESRIGKNGSLISGGQRQKVAMARAIAKSAKILILDEATSNYDYESEHQVNQMVQSRLKKQTVVIITHKPDVLREVNRVFVLDKGRLIDFGKHEELYQRNLFYRQMVKEEQEKSGGSEHGKVKYSHSGS